MGLKVRILRHRKVFIFLVAAFGIACVFLFSPTLNGYHLQAHAASERQQEARKMINPTETRAKSILEHNLRRLNTSGKADSASANIHLCETLFSGRSVMSEGFTLRSEQQRLQQLDLISRTKQLILCPGAGTTATRGLFESLCKLGVPSLHWKKLCLPLSKAKECHPEPLFINRKQKAKGKGKRPELNKKQLVQDSSLQRLHNDFDDGSAGHAELVNSADHLKRLEAPASIMTDVTAAPKFPRSEVVNSILSRLFAVGNHSFVSAIMDSPVTEFFWDLYHMFPHAKVVLTVRDVDEWAFKRVKEHHGVHSIFPISQAFGRLLLQMIFGT